MKKILFLAVLMTTQAFALDAVVTVLEAPIFREPNVDSKIVQYKRKGDIIKVHPSLDNEDRFDSLAPSPSKSARVRKELSETPEWQEDPLFRGKELKVAHADDEFIPILDRQGKLAYILSSQIFVYYNNRRELDKRISSDDPTDYRLQEPLLKKYPIITENGYRGQFLLGLTQPYYESYPYLQSVKTKGYQSPIDVNITLLKRYPKDVQDRFYWGGTLNVRAFQNSYMFMDNSSATENGLRFGIGPYLSYDAFKGEQNRVNLFTSLNVNVFNRLQISQQNAQGSESRTYRGYSVSPRVGFQYHRKNIVEELDFVLGTALEFEPPTSFQAQNAGSQTAMWRRIGGDSFTTRNSISLAVFLGIQSAY